MKFNLNIYIMPQEFSFPSKEQLNTSEYHNNKSNEIKQHTEFKNLSEKNDIDLFWVEYHLQNSRLLSRLKWTDFSIFLVQYWSEILNLKYLENSGEILYAVHWEYIKQNFIKIDDKNRIIINKEKLWNPKLEKLKSQLNEVDVNYDLVSDWEIAEIDNLADSRLSDALSLLKWEIPEKFTKEGDDFNHQLNKLMMNSIWATNEAKLSFLEQQSRDLPYIPENIEFELMELWGKDLLDLINLKNSIELSSSMRQKFLSLNKNDKNLIKEFIENRIVYWLDHRIFDILPYIDSYNYSARLPRDTLEAIYNILDE